MYRVKVRGRVWGYGWVIKDKVGHRRRLPLGNGGDCPRRKTSYRAPPCVELDPPFDIKLVFVQKITFLLRKRTKTAAF